MPDQLRGVTEVLVTVIGLILIAVSATAIVINLIADVLKLFRQNTSFGPQSLPNWLEKLPERYFVPTVLLLLGILLADPDLFAQYGGALFGDSSNSGS